MSEYQYYDFRAIDRALTPKQMEALRKISKRARITPVSFTIEYNFGALRKDPEVLLRRFFDAHVYLSNWGAVTFMLRLPIDALPKPVAEAFSGLASLQIQSDEEFWIVSWRIEGESAEDWLGGDEDGDWMSRLVSVREELLRGDFRSLYIGWLADVRDQWFDEEESEPLLPGGLGSLTAAQEALSEFLMLNPDLLAGAAAGSPDFVPDEPSQAETDDWLASLAPDDVRPILNKLLKGESLRAERELTQRFTNWRRSLAGDPEPPRLRTVGEILRAADDATKNRLEQDRILIQRLEEVRRKQNEYYLGLLAADFGTAWAEVGKELVRGTGPAYEKCCAAIVDLRDAYTLHSDQDAFSMDFKSFMAPHMKRGAFLRRLQEAGLSVKFKSDNVLPFLPGD